MTEAEFVQLVGEALVDAGVTSDWSTFEGAGLLTGNEGLVVDVMVDGDGRNRFQLTVVADRRW